MIITSLYIDNGLIYDDYRLKSTNFNPNINYDPKLRETNDPLYMYLPALWIPISKIIL